MFFICKVKKIFYRRMTSNKLLFSANTDSNHNDGDITVEVDDYVAAVYDCKAYVGKVFDELDVHISFYAQK